MTASEIDGDGGGDETDSDVEDEAAGPGADRRGAGARDSGVAMAVLDLEPDGRAAAAGYGAIV